MALPPLQGIELFSGVGMLGEGLRAGLAHLGIPYRAVCHVEREAHAASVMVARMEEGSMDAAPVWSDVTTFDAAAWRGKVDCIVAGFPCQDLSVAGKRAGLDGKRSGLFFEVTRIADDSGAWLMLLENVAGIASATATVMDEAEGELDERAASRVVGELADLGWDAEWITLSASDVGASHGRARWFCLAWRMGAMGYAGFNAGNAKHRKQPEGAAGRAGQSGEDSFNVVDAARDVGDGGIDREAWSRRGVCEASDTVDDSMRAERRQSYIAGTCGEQRYDTGRAEKNCRAGSSDEALGNTNQQRPHRSGTPGQQTGCGEPAHASGSMDVTARLGWREGRPEPARQQGRCDAYQPGMPVADASSSRQQGPELGRTCNGHWGGRKHMDQLANFVAYSPQAQATRDGQTSSTDVPSSRRHLNPLFGAWLMGWPSTWVIAEPHASNALATASWRFALQQQLSCLLDEQGLHKDAA